jgi:hypothetical protein
MATRPARARLGRAPAPTLNLLGFSRRVCPAVATSRVFWLKAAVILAFCVGLFMSARLWIGPRSYPTIPVSSLVPGLDGTAAFGLFAALFVLSAPILAAPKPQKYIAAFLAIIVVFCLLDQTRWQPWVFQYSFLLATLALFSWRGDDDGGLRRTLNIARLVVASTYIFSGLQKLNLNFVEYEFPWIVQPITNRFPSTTNMLHLFGMGVPLVQVAFGLGLLTQRFRRASLVVAVSMHLFILAMFGPAGHDWNDIVWPWTAAMAVFDLLLFTGASEVSLREIMWTRGSTTHAAAFGLFVVLPFLSFFNLWDSYLSSALYSGNLTEAQIYTTDAAKNDLPATISRFLVHTSADTTVLNLQRWAIEDLNVTPYPETRVFRGIAKSVCNHLHDPAQLVLIVREQRLFFSRPESGFRCWQL